MSPLLFTLCIEYLSRLIVVYQERSGFKFHSLCGRINLTHLCFSDDLLLFCHGSKQPVSILLEAFDQFSKATGLQMNVNKSNIYMNGVDDATNAAILDSTGMSIASLPFRYLGVPITSKKLSVLDCAILVEKIVGRIMALGARKLSYGGRLVLVQSVLSLIFIITGLGFLCSQKLSSKVLIQCAGIFFGKALNIMIKLPLWRGRKYVCQKTIGKYIRWIASKKDHLWVKWINAIYMKGQDWRLYKPSLSASWACKRLCGVKDRLQVGYCDDGWISQGKHYSVQAGYNWLLPKVNEYKVCASGFSLVGGGYPLSGYCKVVEYKEIQVAVVQEDCWGGHLRVDLSYMGGKKLMFT
ncbi:uncharacterized protein LOC141617999 [Silene latifolia]|uniref:uncharacterized protein LOC141617999 n=1 Tax=Silene latifolia TaxID=37657 RepID=UPI003D76FC59